MSRGSPPRSPSSKSDPHGIANKGFRLGIHLLCGIGFPILFRAVIEAERPSSVTAGIVRDFTEVWLEGNFALWGLSILLPDRWLTAKRVSIVVPLLNLLAFFAVLLL